MPVQIGNIFDGVCFGLGTTGDFAFKIYFCDQFANILENLQNLIINKMKKDT
jgi:hypothetical protein